jgi:hypothetical protein
MIWTLLLLTGAILVILHVYVVPLQNLPRFLQLEWEIWRIDRRRAALAREKEEHLAAIKEERMRAFRAQVPPKKDDDQ